jgi:hypothetical protein
MKTELTLIKVFFVLTTIFLAISCVKDKVDNIEPNCISLQEGLLNNEVSSLNSQISILTQDLKPHPTESDKEGHLNNFTILITRLNKCEELNAMLSCYGCIETDPPQSEILITINSNGNQIQKVLDFTTSRDKILMFSGIHNYNKK